MNWQRGLLRLWVVFAVLWIGISGWYEYVNKPRNQNWGPFNSENRCWNAIAKWPDGQRMTPWDMLDEMDTPENVEINKRNHEWAAESIPERNKWAATVRQKLQECEAQEPFIYRASVLIDRIWSSLKDSLPTVLLPPILVIVVVYLGAWIARGFQV
jgi:hypothetical protein